MNISGVYKIQSKKKPNRIYIGSALNIKKRWRNHCNELRKNNHHSIKLQNHINKYGIKDLQYSIIITCDKDDLVKYEQFFIDSYNPYFNIKKTARKGGGMIGKKHSITTRIKQSNSHKGCKIWNKGLKGVLVSWNKTPIYQYDKEGNFIKEWDCALYVEQELKISRSNIGCVLKGQRKTAGGFIWKYKNVA